MELSNLISLAGLAQLGILVASAMVPSKLNWKAELSCLSRLHRQMYWVYASYIVLSIVSFSIISLLHPVELSSGSGLARAVCAYIAVFWGLRLALQGVFDVKDYLENALLRLGYHALTLVFLGLTLVYGYSAAFS